jgi:pimeloyl-ACP methyl ester carboxylesterase
MEKREQSGFGFLAGAWPLDPKKSTLLFIHGSGGSSIMWTKQVEGLKDSANTVAIDLPGHGRSRGPSMDTIPDYTRSVIEFIDLIGAPRPIPVGLSLGGAIAQQLLLDYAEQIPAAVLVSTGARLRVLPAILENVEKNFEMFLKSMGDFAASEKTNPELLLPLHEETAKLEPRVVLGDFRACDAFDVMERLSEIKVPVLVVTAEDDKLTPTKYGIFLEENISDASRVHLLDAGHLAPAEKPEEFNRAIMEFLSKKKL